MRRPNHLDAAVSPAFYNLVSRATTYASLADAETKSCANSGWTGSAKSNNMRKFEWTRGSHYMEEGPFGEKSLRW